MPIVNVNNHDMYYEIHGQGDPVVYIGGWDTFCHGRHVHLARGITDQYQVLIVDYRGLGESTDDLSVPSTTEMHADDIIALMDHLGWSNVRFVGLVGIGACISQHVALKRPDLIRCLVSMGCWAHADQFLQDQLNALTNMHRHAGFSAFQELVCVMSFKPDYYMENRHKLLGVNGVWGILNDNLQTHERLVEACNGHDLRDSLHKIEAPALILHAALDTVTGPRTTLPIEQAMPNATGVMLEDTAHVIAGKKEKIEFCEILFPYLAKH